MRVSLNIIAILFIFSLILPAQNINFKNLSIQDGLTHVTVYSIYQDKLGNMWFGTRQGLNRYDGNSIEQMHVTPEPEGITDHIVWKISGNNDGLVFFQMNRRLMQYNLRSGEFKSISSMDVDDYIYYQEHLWLINWNELVKISPGDKQFQLVKKLDPDQSGYDPVLLGHRDAIWVAMRNGVQIIDMISGQMMLSILQEYRITALFTDKEDYIWAGTDQHGVFKIDGEGNILNHFNITNEDIRCIEEDQQGNIWAGTFSGLLKLNPDTGEKTIYQHVDKMQFSLSHSSVYSLFRDAQGSIWAGTYYGGVNHFNTDKSVFRIFRTSSLYPNYLSYPIIGDFSEDNDGNLWICTEGGGLNKLNRAKNTISIFKSNAQANSIAHNNLKSIWYDSIRNNLYIGTHTGGLSVLDLKNMVFRNYKHQPGDATSLPDNVIEKMVVFKDKLVLVTHGGIAALDLNSGEFFDFFKYLDIDPPRTGASANILVDSKERIWITFFQGVFMYDVASGEKHVYRHQATDSTSFPRFRVIDIFEDEQNRIFFSTEGCGIAMYNKSGEGFTRFTSKSHGLPSDYCLNMEQAPSGDIIIASYNGITFFNPDTHTLKNYSIHKDFPLGGIIEENGLFVASDGEIFVGGINGMISFYEQDIETVTADYNLYLSKLYINNKVVVPGDQSGVLNKTLPYTSAIELNHKQTNINIEFAASNYIQHLKKDFEYKLEGFNESWIPADGFTMPYTNINPGIYTLVVREKQKNIGDIKQARLHIVVTPPYYATSLAYGLYAALIISLFIGIILFNRSKAMLRASLQVERKEKQQIKELNQSKLRFFTNISHEFRTPLTLIINHTDMIQHLKDVPPNIQNYIFKIKKHTSRMRHLINELLDFRKHEQGEFIIHVENTNLTKFLDDIYSSFMDYARTRKIDFQLEYSGEEIWGWIDPYQMQKVFFNLLSNAFRFTPPGEKISLSISQKSQSIVIKVTDTGKGMEEDALNRIFDRFYQVENIVTYEEVNMTSGIGLALSKAIVELHGGKIIVDSILGKGSTFCVEIQIGDSHFTKEQKQGAFAKETINPGHFETPGIPFLNAGRGSDENQEGKPSILIIEDNEDLLKVLKDLFEPVYNVKIAQDGKQGFEQALENVPDIVLSDVMIAKMSGIELCQRLKKIQKTSHIPVVLLTALNDPAQINQALLAGADDYILKPFDSGNLIVRCNNLVSTRRQLKEKFSGLEISEKTLLATDTRDKKFIDRLNTLIEDNLSNSDFNIDVLAREIGIGRSKLYSSVKEVTGLTPNGYILNYKMTKASYYLRTDTRLTISEIASKLGFNSARYFSRCFSEHHGVTPSNMKNRGQDSEK